MTWSCAAHVDEFLVPDPSCDEAPAIDNLYLFRIKFADVKRRLSWFSHMHDAVAEGGSEKTYFSTDQAWMLSHQPWLLGLPEVDGWSALVAFGFDERFMAGVKCNPENGCHSGLFFDGGATFIIPDDFTDLV